MTDDIIVAVYERGGLTTSELRDAIVQAQRELAADSAALADLDVSAEDVEGLFQAKEPESGFVGETILVAIVVGASSRIVADATTAVAKKVWSVIAAKVRSNKGNGALGAEQETRPSDAV
jgi:hypothetical protein